MRAIFVIFLLALATPTAAQTRQSDAVLAAQSNRAEAQDPVAGPSPPCREAQCPHAPAAADRLPALADLAAGRPAGALPALPVLSAPDAAATATAPQVGAAAESLRLNVQIDHRP